VTLHLHLTLMQSSVSTRPSVSSLSTNPEFSERLRSSAAGLWQAQFEHPFIRGIGDGTIDPDRFRFFIRQDYLYLIEYGRLFSLACARAPRLELMERFAELAHSTLRTEMELHRAYAVEWGISREQLEAERPEPTTRAYTNFLLRTGTLGDFGELVAALLPCMWGYSELGKHLALGPRPDEKRCARWIDMYASEEFAELAAWCRSTCESVAADTGEAGRDRMLEAFVTCSRYELEFWDAAWRAIP
jgi:thiaminase/transcriptional activator TenA